MFELQVANLKHVIGYDVGYDNSPGATPPYYQGTDVFPSAPITPVSL
ncbi:MAG: hypothetical protein ACJZ8E_06910 [Pseudohongiellaceae bacterium]